MSQLYEMESVCMKGQSHLEIICGPMFSGKTEELIRRIRRVQYAKLKAIVFKPRIDQRYEEHQVVSHSLHKIPSIPVSDVFEIRNFLAKYEETLHVIGLDEVQFFDLSIIDFCEEMLLKGIRVIAAGLSEDYLQKPFGPMPKLLAHADNITKLWAVCMKCGSPASKTQRICKQGQDIGTSQVMVGASDIYEARCRSCHKKSIVEGVI